MKTKNIIIVIIEYYKWTEHKILPADSQVPDLHLALTDSSKDSSTVWGPHDIKHSLLSRGETKHGSLEVLPPQLNSPIWGTTQENVWTERRPCHLIDGTLRKGAERIEEKEKNV